MPIRVYVVRTKATPYMRMYWTDPHSKKRVYKSSKCRRRSDAERVAAVLEEALNSPDGKPSGPMTWDVFVSAYEAEHLSGRRVLTRKKFLEVAAAFRASAKIGRLTDVTSRVLSKYAGDMRAEDYSEQTIGCHLRHLKAALRWAERQGEIDRCPSFPSIRRELGTRTSHGRPLTEAEFLAWEAEALRAGCPVMPKFLRGLWFSGLRMGEAARMTWDASEFQIDMSGERPYYRIWAGAEKGGQTRLLAVTPDAAAYFRSIMPDVAIGRVFDFGNLKMPTLCHRAIKLSTAAGVFVHDARGRKRAAGCHDLRRSFGERWATRVTPPVLMELMRHSCITTTTTYYVTENAKRTADIVWGLANDAQDRTQVKASEQRKPEPVTAGRSYNIQQLAAATGLPEFAIRSAIIAGLRCSAIGRDRHITGQSWLDYVRSMEDSGSSEALSDSSWEGRAPG